MKHAINNYKRTVTEESQLGKETAARFGEGKIRHDLIPPWCLDELAKVYTYGIIKYDEENWRKGLKWKKQVIGPLLRHLWSWIRGEKIDKESNCHHLAMVVWQCFTLMEYSKWSIGQDERNPYSLDLMDEDERNRRISMWKESVLENKLDEYDGLIIDKKEQNNETTTND